MNQRFSCRSLAVRARSLALILFLPGLLTSAAVAQATHGPKHQPASSAQKADTGAPAPAARFQPFPEPMSEGDAASHRDAWFYGQRAYPFKRIPPGVRMRSLEIVERRFAAERKRAMSLSGTADATLNPAALSITSWTAIGPQPTTTSRLYTSSSGRVESIAIDPRDVNTVYIGTALGGVWKTIDGGQHWTPLTDSQKSLAVSALAIDPNAPNTIYAGTGEGGALAGFDAYYGAGILKSTDGGSTWTQIGSTFIGPFRSSLLCGGGFISSLAIQPNNSQVLLGTAFTCTNSQSNFGVFRSSDGGQSWTLVKSGLAYEVHFDPNNPLVAYTAVGTQFGLTTDSGFGIFKSTDGGQTWSAINGTAPNSFPTTNVGRISLAIAPSQPATMYAAVGRADNTQAMGVWKTTDGGANWTQAAATGLGDYCTDFSGTTVVSAQCWFDNVIAVHPKNPNVVFVGGAENPRNVPLFVSTDGGATFSRATPTLTGEGLHADMHAIAFSNDGTKLYAGNDGGMWSTTDTASTAPNWTNLNATLNITQFYPGIAIDPTDVTQAFGGTQDNGTQQYVNGGWRVFACGDGGWNAFDSTATNVYVSCTGALFIGKASATSAVSLDLTPIKVDQSRMNFVPPMIIDPSNDNTLYFGTQRVWQSQDGGTTWNAISPDLSKGSGSVIYIAVSPADPKTVWALTNDGKVQLSTTATSGTAATWTDKTPTTNWPLRAPTSVVADPRSASTAYVTFSGFSFNASGAQITTFKGHIYRTTDSGATWADITGDLETVNTPVNTIVVDPSLANTIYAATDVGVFVTRNGGVNWTPLGTGMPNVVVLDIKLHKGTRTLRAATHGRGMWDISVPATTAPGGGSLSFSPSFLTFVNQAVGTTSAGQTITVTAAGSAVTISSVVNSGANFVVSNNTCSNATVQSGGTCSFAVSFAPTAAGSQTGSITVNSNGAGSPQTISLEGNGVVASGGIVTPENGWWWDGPHGPNSVGLNGIGFFVEYRAPTGQPSNPCPGNVQGCPGIFVGGFMYDSSGKSKWLVTLGTVGGTFMNSTLGLTYTGKWLHCTNGQGLTTVWKQNACADEPNGAVTITFSDSKHATLTRPDGSLVPLTRFSFTPSSVPVSPEPGTAQNGWWWIDPSSPTFNSGGGGIGYGIEFQGSAAFIVAYVYDTTTGNPIWYLTQNGLPSPTSYIGTWNVYKGGPEWTSPELSTWSGSIDTSYPGVNVTLNFTDLTHGTMTMGGVTIPITKFTKF